MSPSLRRTVKDATGQDVRQCQGCQLCNLPEDADADIPLGSLIQMVLFDDEEVLTTRTLWSERVLENSRHTCHKGLNLQAILITLREEAKNRGLV